VLVIIVPSSLEAIGPAQWLLVALLIFVGSLRLFRLPLELLTTIGSSGVISNSQDRKEWLKLRDHHVAMLRTRCLLTVLSEFESVHTIVLTEKTASWCRKLDTAWVVSWVGLRTTPRPWTDCNDAWDLDCVERCLIVSNIALSLSLA